MEKEVLNAFFTCCTRLATGDDDADGDDGDDALDLCSDGEYDSDGGDGDLPDLPAPRPRRRPWLLAAARPHARPRRRPGAGRGASFAAAASAGEGPP